MEAPPDTGWQQYLIEFADPADALRTAARELAPALDDALNVGELRGWWYIRKTPAWRLRCQQTDPGSKTVDLLLADLATRGHVARWTRGIYEPETLAFGGRAGMDIAHTLFHEDSQHVLARVREPVPTAGLGQRETTVLLYSAMLRAAGLDWFEQGDTWAKVTALRPTNPTQTATPERSQRLRHGIRTLMAADPRGLADHLPATWLSAFITAGEQLATLARWGQLERGLRAILAHHFIFHANRADLSTTDQASMASRAVGTVFHEHLHVVPDRRTLDRSLFCMERE
ncbi:thiopeptide-type bacteriocin biosynthesis protein [Haloechinothrix halophila]|uniref:thiopeptide-type bacteriocin biosynthesis protein n=1 Tax=Haloechinothrix halophila TaxID=1069073 RepID=UPI000686D989|nr:thiopeptide-type bacteriocin biosynthesis protein [Haloechinothrix halophila]